MMESSRPFLSAIMPVFNEEQNLPWAIGLLTQKLEEQVESFEILIVDDGSRDRTGEIASKLAAADPRLRIITHPENRGPGSGLHTGIPACRGEWITFIPADLAIDLDQFPRYLAAARQAEVVVGLRSDRRDYSFFRKLSSLVYIWLIKVLFLMKEKQFNFVHLYHRSIFEHIRVQSSGVFITAEILIKARDAGFRLKEVMMDYVPRQRGAASCGRPEVIWRTFFDVWKFWFPWVFSRLSRRFFTLVGYRP